jgi:hypothetical protein
MHRSYLIENIVNLIIGDNQIWNNSGNDDAMYFANNHYLLRYNGVKWEKYMPPKTIIRR